MRRMHPRTMTAKGWAKRGAHRDTIANDRSTPTPTTRQSPNRPIMTYWGSALLGRDNTGRREIRNQPAPNQTCQEWRSRMRSRTKSRILRFDSKESLHTEGSRAHHRYCRSRWNTEMSNATAYGSPAGKPPVTYKIRP